jgi:hypothetical protein
MNPPSHSRRWTGWEMAVLAAVPMGLILAGVVFRAMAGVFEADPDYVYLLNGLDILTLYPPGYYDHPGTTLEVIAAFVTWATWLFSPHLHNAPDIKTAVLLHPEYFLRAINLVLIAANAVAAFYMSLRIRMAAGLGAALVAQLSILISFSVMIGLNRVTPEPLLLAASLVLAGYLAPLVLQPERFVETGAYAMGLGMLLGFILATKITALPLLAAILFLRTRKLRWAAVKAGAAAGLILTLPIAVHYPQMAKWFARLFIHTGAYGGGPKGVVSPSELWPSFVVLLGQAPEIFVMFGLYAISLPLWRGGFRRVMVICAVILAVSILMVLKHPGARYFMPIVGIIALANAAIVSQSLAEGGAARIGGILLMLVLAVGIGRNLLATSTWARNARENQSINQKLIAATIATGCRPIFFYGVNTPLYNLGFGEEYTVHHFSAELNRLYPDALFYDVFGHRFESFSGPLSMKDARIRLAAGRCFRLVGSPVERFNNDFGFGLPREEISLVARTPYGLGDSVAVYAWQPR